MCSIQLMDITYLCGPMSQVGCAIAIITITALHLYNVTYETGSTSITVNCQLGTSFESVNLCDCKWSRAVHLQTQIQ